LEFAFKSVEFAAIRDEVRAHLAAAPNAVDSYMEEHILGSNHYRIVVDGRDAGFASIHGESLITQFAVARPFRQFGQPLFAKLRRTESVQSAYVPTCDEFYLSHALDDHRVLNRQAYFFAARDEPVVTPAEFRLEPATLSDVDLIRAESGDFFDPIETRIGRHELFKTLRNDEPVGFGIREISALYDDVASIGMFTLKNRRQSGAGAATIALLIADTRRKGLRPVAGCWYYNHASKRTLERAGLAAATRLLKIEF
jgi:hypothetical protein